MNIIDIINEYESLVFVSTSIISTTITFILSLAFRRAKSKRGQRIFILMATISTALMAFVVIIQTQSRIQNSMSNDVVFVLICLLIILIMIIITIYATPSRMTVIAGIAISLVIAVVMVETFLWLHKYMNDRIERANSLEVSLSIRSEQVQDKN